ncbi:MAG TPA: helicase-related protein [Gemmatimonadaceae bacterium]|jgi:superfamily II DNA or RNA helicase
MLTARETRTTNLAAAKHAIASALLGGRTSVSQSLGKVVLRPHQRAAAARIVSLIGTHGGAMLAEPVGVGKTFTALAVVATVSEKPLLVVPAALRQMWAESLAHCGVSATLVSHEELSRGKRPTGSFDFIVVDESHRLRSPAAHRYGVLAELCRVSKVLLVTATPVQNARSDLAVQLALFLGRGVWQMSDEELASYVVRGRAYDDDDRPTLAGPHLVPLDIDDDCVDALIALPPPVPARNEAVAAALLSYGLLHQWTSSRAALERALQRSRARSIALSEAIDAGRQPTRAELSAWSCADDALQLAFPEIVADHAIDADIGAATLRGSLERHRVAVESVLATLRSAPNPDDARAAALRRIRAEHPGERIIAFCQYAETVNMLRTRLARDNGVAALTAHGGRVAGGRITRDDILAQFTVGPRAGRENASERIELLITTDLLSEGLNLQGASVIVHLDLPWNPARLDQRVGRALRLGSTHPVVTVYMLSPPAAAERLMHIERRLREKLCVAQRTVGIAGRIMPSPLGVAPNADRGQQGLAERQSAVSDALRPWLDSYRAPLRTHSLCVGAAVSDHDGFLALVKERDELLLVADLGSGIDTQSSTLLAAVAACSGPEVSIDESRMQRAVGQLKTWLSARAGESLVDFRAAGAARTRRDALQRVAQMMARVPRHERVALLPLADAVRAVATARLSEGAERILDDLVRAQLPDEAWLRSVATFSALNVRGAAPEPNHSGAASSSRAGEIVALVLFGPPAL